MHTGKVIEETLFEIGMSRTSFAKNLGISKSYLLAVINGKKPCSENLFNKIMNCASIPAKNKSFLADEFFSDKYGANSYKNLKYLISEINNLNRDTKKAYPVRYNVIESLIASINPLVVNNCDELIEITHWFLLRDIDSEDFCFYTNYTFEQTALNDFLFYFFSKNGLKNNFDKDFVHISQMHPLTDRENIHSIFETVRFARIGLKAYYITSDMSLDFLLFPYYIVMNECVIVFDFDCLHSIIYTDSTVVDYYKGVFLNEKKNIKPVVSIYTDPVDMMTDLDTMPKFTDISCSMSGMFCGEFLTYDILNEIAVKDLPNRELLIKKVLLHYSLSSLKVFYTTDALKNFADTGNLAFISDKYASSCPPQIRMAVLQNLLTHTEENDNQQNVFLLDKDRINLPENIDISIWDSTMAVCGSYRYDSSDDSSSENGLPLYFLLFFDSLTLTNIFSKLFDFFVSAEYVYGYSHTKRLVDELIIKISSSITPPPRKIRRVGDN